MAEPHPVPLSAHPGAEAEHAAVLAAPHRSWWTHAEPGRTLQAQLVGALAAGTPIFPDISEHNGAVDWELLERAWRAGLILAVAMRAGFGTVRADKQFARNRDEARRRGIPAVFYWFCYSAYNSAAAEAAMFNRTVGPLRPGEAMAGDFEDDPNAKPFVRGAAGLRWCQDFLGALQSPRNATWGYSYPALISVIGLQPLWQTWPFWLADWGRTPDSAFGYAALRQFTNCGSTPGVGGCCDQSRVLQGPLSRWLTAGGPPVPARPPATITPTGAAMSAIQVYYPPIPGRVDTFLIDPDSRGVYRQFTGGGAGGEDNLSHRLQDWWGVGNPPAGGFESLTLGVVVDDLGRWIVTAVNRIGPDRGQTYELVLRIDGGADQDWTPIGPPVALPAVVGAPGPAGPIGPAGPPADPDDVIDVIVQRLGAAKG